MNTITEHNGLGSTAIFSSDKIYRYFLSRKTGIPGNKKLIWIMLNPSTADAFKLDPTVIRCFVRSKRHSANEMIILNLFGFRSPYPKDLYTIEDPIGPDNDEIIASSLQGNNVTLVCAWGSHKLVHERSLELWSRLVDISKYCLGTTKTGQPKHPLHVAYEDDLIPFDIF